MKRNFVRVVLVLLLCVVGIGFVRGWFVLSNPSPNPGSKKVNINLTVDRDKVQEDAETLRKKTSELTGKATEEVKEFGDQVKSKK